MCPSLGYNPVVSESSAIYSLSQSLASIINLLASLLSVIPKAILSSIFTTFFVPAIYSTILFFESSHSVFTSGLKAIIAGFITGINLSSTTLPLYSIIEVTFV